LFANCQALTGGFRAWVAAIMIVPMILEALLAMTVEYGTPTPQLNPAICANVRRVSGGYQVTQETWALPVMKLPAGTIIKRGRTMVAGRDLVALIEK
jgi:hypothetical protein